MSACWSRSGRLEKRDVIEKKGETEVKRNRILVTAALVLLLLLSLAGCEFFTALFSPVVGEWTLFFRWGTAGTYSSGIIEFKWNQMFEDGSYRGTWSQDGDEITFEYEGGTIYTGTLDSDRQGMSGTMISWDGRSGQWYAEKGSGSDTAARAGLQTER